MNDVVLIWTTVLIFLLSGYIFTSANVFLFFIILWVVRLICLRRFPILVQALIIGACFFIHFNNRVQSIKQYSKSLEDVEMMLKVHPDDIKVMEDGLSVRAFNNSFNKQGVQAFIPISNSKELAMFQNVTEDVTFKIKGNIEPLDSPTNINQFDFRRISYGKSIYFKLTKCNLNGYQLIKNSGIISKIHSWRKKLLQRCQKLPDPLQSYCMGIILGEQTNFLKENSDKLRNMGIIHLFCISGLHVFYFIKLIEKLAIFFKMKRETMELLQLQILPIYFILGGGSTSLLRAVLLVLVQLLTKKLHLKDISALDIWCIVLLFNLWINPFVLLQMGGQLSYLLSFVLIVQAESGELMLSIKLFLVEIPIILFSTYKIHALTILFNLIAVPIFSSVVVPIVILSFTLPILANVLNPLIIIFEIILKLLNQLPGMIMVGKPSRVLVLIAIIIALKIISTSRVKLKKILLKAYFLMWISVWGFFKFVPFGEVSFFDVGQGDSILIREPFNRSVSMIDTGGKVQFGKEAPTLKHTIAKYSSINYLQSMGISRIDNLCLTHQDLDHIGEASEILKNFKVNQLVFPYGVETTSNYHQNIEPFLQKTKVVRVLNGSKVKKLPMSILYPLHPGKGENGDSLVLNGRLGGKTFLLTGDLDLNGEHDLIETGNVNQHIDIFKLGHHGSKTANSEELLKSITPNLTIISAGRNNRYGHPNKEVIDRLNQLQISHVSTQDVGMISYRFLFNGVARWKTGIDNRGRIVQ